VTDIVEMTGCSERSLLRWCDAYERGGIRGLVSGWKGGNNAKLTQAQRVEMISRLRQFRPDQVLSPGERSSHATSWTVNDVRIALKRWYGVTWRSDNSYRALLSEAKLHWLPQKTPTRSDREEQAVTGATPPHDNGEDELMAYIDDFS
jgi:transposase